MVSLERTTDGGVSFPMALLFWKFHEGHPKGFAALVAEERLFVCQGKDGMKLQLDFSPFEDENTVGFEDTEAFLEAHGQLRLPVLIQFAIPLVKVGCLASPYQVRRVKNHHLEAVVRVWHIGEVADGVRVNHHQLPVRQVDIFIADVHELHEGVVFVEPEHPAATTSV